MTSSRSLIETQRCRETDFLVIYMIKLLELPHRVHRGVAACSGGREYPTMDPSWQWPQTDGARLPFRRRARSGARRSVRFPGSRGDLVEHLAEAPTPAILRCRIIAGAPLDITELAEQTKG
jgi:hypothetical protein